MSDEITEIVLARWSERFLAWLVDFVIISIISATVISLITGGVELNVDGNDIWAESASYIPTSLLFFAYWTILEYKTGQTIGKKIFRLKIINANGSAPGLKEVMISSVGKAFLLPLDVLFGWIFTNKNRQRIFNRLGDTMVAKITDDENNNIIYTKD